MKLFPKLALAVLTLLIATTADLSVSFYLSERRSIRLQADQERRSLLQTLAHIVQESFLTNDDLLLVKYARWMQKMNPSIVSVSVVSPRGDILAHSEPRLIGKPDPAAETPTEQAAGHAEVLILTQPVRLGTRWVATASAAFSEKHFEEAVTLRLRELQKRLALIAAGGITAGLLVSFLLALSWTRPIGALARASQQVGRGDYRLELGQTGRRRDELGFLARVVQSMAEQLQQLDQMKEDFVSAVTHELRSPLGAIESYLNLIKEEIREGISPASWQTYVDRLRLNTQRLTRFVNDLLDVAALERGRVGLDRQPVDLVVLIQEVAALYAAQLSERRLACHLLIPRGAVPRAWADADKIRQVLVNLLSNAIKFTPEGGTLEIGLDEVPAEHGLRVTVKDTGLGISEEDQKRIFNKFEQVRSARQKVNGPKGSGLGLPICRALIELHQGTLGVKSQAGQGSCFYFTLPAAQGAAA